MNKTNILCSGDINLDNKKVLKNITYVKELSDDLVNIFFSPYSISDNTLNYNGLAYFAGAYIVPNHNLYKNRFKNIIFIASNAYIKNGHDYFVMLLLHEIGHTFTRPDKYKMHEQGNTSMSNGTYLMNDPLMKFSGPNNFVSFSFFLV